MTVSNATSESRSPPYHPKPSEATKTVVAEAYALRNVAEAGPIGKRHSSFELYELLAECAKLAERLGQNPADAQEMRKLITQTGAGNRAYVEHQSDEYILVCRFVFSNLRSKSAERSNASRYAHALRQARKIGITGNTLAKHLATNGGINALFLKRPLNATTISTKCLQLARPITIAKSVPFTLRLTRMDDNTYTVVSGPDE